MRILYVVSLYRPHVGGIETMVEELSSRLARLGHTATVLAKRWPRDLPEHELLGGVAVLRVPTATSLEEYRATAAAVARASCHIDIDLVHVIGMRRPLPLHALLLARESGIPVVGTVAGGEIPEPADPDSRRVWEAGRSLIGPCYPRFDRIVAVSDATAERASALTGLTVATLPAGIDVARCRPPAAERPKPYIVSLRRAGVVGAGGHGGDAERPKPYIVSLRRLEAVKGVDLLIRAFADAAEALQDVELVIAGDGRERQSLEQLARRLRVDQRVTFLGAVTLDDGLKLLRGALLTAVPSRAEAGGLVNTQAAAAGCPVVAADVGGVREYAEPTGTYLVPAHDVPALADALVQVANDHALRERLRQHASTRARSLDWSNVLPRYLELYEELIALQNQTSRVAWNADVAAIEHTYRRTLTEERR